MDRPKRSNVFMAASLKTENDTSDVQLVRIRDISAGGAKVQGPMLDVGTQIILTRGRFTIPARVVWCGDAQFGVAFDKPINVDEKASSHGTVRPTDRRAVFGLRVTG